jgi:hypothetical protein
MLGCIGWLILTFIQVITALFCIMLWLGGVNGISLLIAFVIFNVPLVVIKNLLTD